MLERHKMEILEIMTTDEKRMQKMTRDEAIKKLQSNDIYRGAYADQIVAALELLGLLEFTMPALAVRTPSDILRDARQIAREPVDWNKWALMHKLIGELVRLVDADQDHKWLNEKVVAIVEQYDGLSDASKQVRLEGKLINLRKIT